MRSLRWLPGIRRRTQFDSCAAAVAPPGDGVYNRYTFSHQRSIEVAFYFESFSNLLGISNTGIKYQLSEGYGTAGFEKSDDEDSFSRA